MRNQAFHFLLSTLTTAVIAGFPSGSNCCAEQTGVSRSFFAADYHKGFAAIVSPVGALSLKRPIRDIHDTQALPDGGWLTQTNFQEVIEINSKGEQVWKYEPDLSKGHIEIHAFQRLNNGLTMIAESGATRIIEVDRDGKIQHSIPLQVTTPDAHRDTRIVRVTGEGNYLVSHESDQCVREYNRDGKIVWEFNVGSKLYSAVRLGNGNTLIGAGDGHRVIEVNPSGKIVWEVTENELPNVKLAWVTMVDRLTNGNTWIVNCHCLPDQPQIIEVTPDKKIAWSFKDLENFGDALPVAVPIR